MPDLIYMVMVVALPIVMSALVATMLTDLYSETQGKKAGGCHPPAFFPHLEFEAIREDIRSGRHLRYRVHLLLCGGHFLVRGFVAYYR